MRIGVTMKELKKIEIIKKVINKEIKGVQASRVLGYHKVHISRLKKRYLEEGELGMVRKGIPSPRRIKDEIKEQVTRLKQHKYFDFNILHFKERLEELEKINLSYETVRKILIEKGVHSPKKKKVVHRRRRRMPKAGMLIQMDSSQHQWIKKVKNKWWLTAAVDDATSEILYMKFYPSDGVFNNMGVLRAIIEQYGVFYSLYVDKASHFTTTRLGGLHVEVDIEQQNTHIERALDELGITMINANSPQAKGRIERAFGTLQDRLIAEMRLHGINSYKKANEFIEKYFIKYYNEKFAKNTEVDRVFKPLNPTVNLDLIFCKRYQRKVKKDNTISFLGNTIQLLPTKHKLSFAGHIVDICLLEDNRMFILYKNKTILESKMLKNSIENRKYKKIKALLNQREYVNA